MSARKKFKVTRGNSIMWVSPWRGRWRFAWRKKPGDPWRYTVRSTKEEAEKAAALKMAELPTGGLSWAEISLARRHFLEAIHRDAGPADEDALLEFLASRRQSGGIAAAVARLIEDKTAAKGGHETPHLARVRRELEALAEHFSGRVLMDITHPDLRAWWTTRTGEAGDARKQALRTTLAMFWKWARKDGINFPTRVGMARGSARRVAGRRGRDAGLRVPAVLRPLRLLPPAGRHFHGPPDPGKRLRHQGDRSPEPPLQRAAEGQSGMVQRRPPGRPEPLHGPPDLLLLRGGHLHLPGRRPVHHHRHPNERAGFLEHP